MSQFGLFEKRPEEIDTLDKLIAKMLQMDDDPLANAGTRVVISRGNPQARILIVGEAPGPQENCSTKSLLLWNSIAKRMYISPIRFFGCRPANMDKTSASRTPPRSNIIALMFLRSFAL